MDIYVNTLFDRMDAMNFKEPPYAVKYPELLKLYGDEPALPKNNRIVRNVSYGGRWLDLYDGIGLDMVAVRDNVIADSLLVQRIDPASKKYVTLGLGDTVAAAEFTAAGNVLVNGDPGFVNAAKKDFRLRKKSPAFSRGFKPIPMEKIGLYKDEYRKSVAAKGKKN
jgi:hypothetical protein